MEVGEALLTRDVLGDHCDSLGGLEFEVLW
jgi:hypothetical protein